MAARFQRQQCFLCDLPHSPWAVLHDFSEPICRGCCNYEGADRIEEIIQYVRILRRNWEKAEGNRSRNLKNERLNSTGSSVSSTPSPPPSHGASNNGGPNFPVSAEHRRMLGKYQNVPKGAEDGVDPASYQNASGPYPKISSPETANGSKAGPNRAMGNIVGREGERRTNFYEDTRHSMLNGSGVRNHQGQLIAQPLGQPPHLALEVPRQEYIAHETINILNRTVPFDIRFKKDHNLVGRVFAFDISSKLGQELELKLLMEYPRGSGCIYQSASRLAKQMHVDASKEYGRGVSSGFKYIEYEKDRTKGEWRILGELLLESVRLFKEPVLQELLPLRQFEQDDPPIPAVSLSFNPRPGGMYGRKRKGTDIDDYDPGRPAGMMGRFTKDEIIHQAWVHAPAEYGKLAAGGAVFPGTPVSSIPSASVLPMVTTPVTKGNVIPLPVSDSLLHPQTKSPINAVPGKLDGAVVGMDSRSVLGIHATPATSAGCVSPSCRSPRPPNGPISKSAETQSGGHEGEGKERNSGSETNVLRCSLCHDKLEDTHFVQCPSIGHHKFCFPCSRDSIKKQGAGSEVFCPSGERCPLQGSNLPWAFMQGEIATILGTEFAVKKEKEN